MTPAEVADRLIREADLRPMHWLHYPTPEAEAQGYDAALSLCYDCAKRHVDAGLAEDVDGGWGGMEEDNFQVCGGGLEHVEGAGCGTNLDAGFTDYLYHECVADLDLGEWDAPADHRLALFWREAVARGDNKTVDLLAEKLVDKDGGAK